MSLQIQDPEDHKSNVWRFQVCGPKTQGSPFLPSFDAQSSHSFSVFLADVMYSSVFSLCFQGWQREDLNLWHWWHFWHVQWHLWHLWCLWHLRHLWRGCPITCGSIFQSLAAVFKKSLAAVLSQCKPITCGSIRVRQATAPLGFWGWGEAGNIISLLSLLDSAI